MNVMFRDNSLTGSTNHKEMMFKRLNDLKVKEIKRLEEYQTLERKQKMAQFYYKKHNGKISQFTNNCQCIFQMKK